MVLVIELEERRPPVGKVGREGALLTEFNGWLGLIATLSRLIDAEDERIASELVSRLVDADGSDDAGERRS